jgi:DNA polymerase, archaea type
LETIKVMRAWDKGRNKVAYVYRDPETGKTKLGETKFENWFYVKTSDYEQHKSLFLKFKEERTVIRFESVGKYVKIFYENVHNDELLNRDMEWVWEYKNFNFNKMLEKLKMLGVQTYEADVKACKRWMLSDNVEIERDYKVVYYDIETDDRHADGLTPGKYRILSIAFKYSDSNNADGKMIWLVTEEDTDEAEKEMLEKAAKIINHFDVIVSFNGQNFDDPYIKSRFARYGICVDWRKKFLQDHCWTYKKYGLKLTSYSLDNISKSVLKRGKIEHSGMRIWDMWQNNRQLLKEYNCEDVQLMYDIECKNPFLSAHRDICAAGMCSVDDLYVSRKIDNFILKQAQEDNEYHFKTVEFQSAEEMEEIDESYEGAFVFPPIVGRHKNVRVVDFASLYPNVINTLNISPDTLIEDGDDIPADKIILTPTRHRYRKDYIGILPKVVMKLAAKRKFYNDLKAKEVPDTTQHKVYDRMQYLYKYFGLSFYGCMGEKHNRAYDIRVAESITLSGQYFTKNCAKYVEKQGLVVITGDTDSLFIGGLKNHHQAKQLANKLSELCLAHAKQKFNCDICTIKMEYDKGFKTYLTLAKKRYAGILDFLDGHEINEFNMYVAGLEYKRTDVTKVVKEWQWNLLKEILQDEEAPAIETIREMVLGWKEGVFSGKLSAEDISLAQKITKELDDYEGRQMHVMVANEMKADGKEVWIGDKVPYFIIGLDGNKKPIPKPLYKFSGKYCESYYWNNKIFPALQRILEVVYPKIDWEGYKAQGSGEVKTGRTNLW